MRSTLRWLMALTLVALAVHLKSPYLLKLRALESFVLCGLSLAGGVFSVKSLLKTRNLRKFFEIGLALLFACAFFLTLEGELRFQWIKYRVLHADAEILRMLGRHFVIGYRDPRELEPLLARGALGGIFVTRRNIEGKDMAAIRAEISGFQRRQPLLIATDQEGGIVSRLSPPLDTLPPLAELADLPSPQRQIRAARRYGAQQGRELAGLGINLNFSPVVDLKYPPRDNPLDFHSLIHRRAIAAEPDTVARIALAYTQGLKQHGVHATLKHFPGLGPGIDDTHHFRARLGLSKARLEARDWQPFRHVLAHSPALLMLGHVVLESVDPQRPVSHSRAVVEGIIRNEWGHDGVIITDDLSMGAIYRQSGGICRAAVEALAGGVDLLLVAYDNERYYPAMACLIQAYETGELDAARLARSAERLRGCMRISTTRAGAPESSPPSFSSRR